MPKTWNRVDKINLKESFMKKLTKKQLTTVIGDGPILQ
jgi:hypothetical protein